MTTHLNERTEDEYDAFADAMIQVMMAGSKDVGLCLSCFMPFMIQTLVAFEVAAVVGSAKEPEPEHTLEEYANRLMEMQSDMKTAAKNIEGVAQQLKGGQLHAI